MALRESSPSSLICGPRLVSPAQLTVRLNFLPLFFSSPAGGSPRFAAGGQNYRRTPAEYFVLPSSTVPLRSLSFSPRFFFPLRFLVNPQKIYLDESPFFQPFSICLPLSSFVFRSAFAMISPVPIYFASLPVSRRVAPPPLLLPHLASFSPSTPNMF